MKGILSPLPELEASLFISSETVTLTKFLSVQVTSEITAKQTNGNQSSPRGGEAGEGEKKKEPTHVEEGALPRASWALCISNFILKREHEMDIIFLTDKEPEALTLGCI